MRRRALESLCAVAVLLLAALVLAYPFAWMVAGIGKTNAEIFNARQFWPAAWNLAPARQLLAGEWFPFWRVLVNSFLVAAGQSALAVGLTALAGYAFANACARKTRLLLPAALVVVVLPVQSLAVPLLSWIHELGLVNRLWGVILPGAVSGIGVFWFTQVFRQMPASLREAARLDGAGEWRVWWTLLPAVKPALLSFALIHFILAWHEHLVPLLILAEPGRRTMPVAIASLYGSGLHYPYAALMTASVISLVPTVVLFALGYRRFKSALADVLMH